jgi:hypothetical protein
MIPPGVRAAFEAAKLADFNVQMLQFLGEELP